MAKELKNNNGFKQESLLQWNPHKVSMVMTNY